MQQLDADSLPNGALLLIDSAPIIYTLEAHPKFARKFSALFKRHQAGEITFAVSTITVAEVLVGPIGAGEEGLAKRYRTMLESWRVVDLSVEIAVSAARLRTQLKLKLPDAIQVASALAIGADALVTHDNDFAKVQGLLVLG